MSGEQTNDTHISYFSMICIYLIHVLAWHAYHTHIICISYVYDTRIIRVSYVKIYASGTVIMFIYWFSFATRVESLQTQPRVPGENPQHSAEHWLILISHEEQIRTTCEISSIENQTCYLRGCLYELYILALAVGLVFTAHSG